MKKVLAFDMGATSIRGILGFIEDGRLKTQEIMRFSHRIVKRNGRLRWQWADMLEKLRETIVAHAGSLHCIGVDTWGVDFGLLDERGELVADPISYRDKLHERGYAIALSEMKLEEIFFASGNQVMPINTLFQLLALREAEPGVFAEARTMLLMPDLFHYILCGAVTGEETIWSTSQLVDLRNGDYSQRLSEAFSLLPSLFPKRVQAKTILGTTATSRIPSLRSFGIPVMAVCGHDTASAVLLTEAFRDEDCLFLSCGTWSLLGVGTKEAVICPEVFEKNLTNERGFASRNLLFKNLTGLYLIEKYKRQLESERNREITYSEINDFLQKTKGGRIPPDFYIDMEDPRFAVEDQPVKETIDSILRERKKEPLEGDFDYFLLIYESLAQKYLETKKAVESITGKTYRKLHMIGGGSRSEFLCRLVANRLETEVIAGPGEASALGNILVQLLGLGEITSLEEGVRLALAEENIKIYQPNTESL